jgi:hypothetical protein
MASPAMIPFVRRCLLHEAACRSRKEALPACQARCAEPCMRGRRVGSRDRSGGQANSSARARIRIWRPDSSSRGSIWAFGQKHSRLARICSGSRDRPVLGHLCTDRPENACIGIARARERAYALGGWAAGPAHHIWGTAAKQWQVSHAHHGRAAADRKMHLHAAVKAQWRLSVLSCSSDRAASALHADQHT